MADDHEHERRNRQGLGAGGTAVRRGEVTRAAIRAIRAARWFIRITLQVILALVILFEEWGWQPLSRALAALGRFSPIARIERRIGALPPYAALAVFAVPSLLLIPLKLLALWLIAGGHVMSAGLLFAGAKVVGTALVARLYQLTEPALMQLSWFRRAYGVVMPWKDALLTRVRESWVWRQSRVLKRRVGMAIRQLAVPLRAAARSIAERLSGLRRPP
jgi:hypothetical protein